jgi:putative hemolysin
MRLPTTSVDARVSFSKIALSLAITPEEIREVQRLRYKVFTEAMGLSALARPDGLDQDELDAYCDHLIVRDMHTLKVVGAYRVLSPRAAVRCGRLHAEQAFDLDRLQHVRGKMMEAGRACIHPDYRGSGVLMMLWAGLSALMKREGCEYLASCISVSLADGGYNATALYQRLSATHLAPLEYRVAPRTPFVLHKCEPGHAPYVPPLLEGYLRGGAWIGGEPAWDPDFNCADFFLLLPMDAIYRRPYLSPTSSIAGS